MECLPHGPLLKNKRSDTQRALTTAAGPEQRLVRVVSPGCRDKAPQTEWLRATETDSVPVLEAGSVKARCRQGHVPSAGSSEGPSFPLPGSLAHGHITRVSAATVT